MLAIGISFKTKPPLWAAAISLAEDMHAKEMMPMVYFTVGAAINHWTQPLKGITGNSGVRG
jgi:hypothetical protein